MVKRRKKSPCSAKTKKIASKVRKTKKRVVKAKKDFLDKVFDLI